ncbi:MAG: ribosome silencing factor [Nibricoccus sp.]
MKSKKAKVSIPTLLTDICRVLDDKKAEEVKVLRVSAQSSITDYLVLANGTSEPHLRALRVELEKVIDRSGTRIVGMDTEQGSGWLVIDAFDIMVHVFTPENRRKYALEALWKDAEDLPLQGVLKVAAVEKPKRRAAAPKKSKPAKTKRK